MPCLTALTLACLFSPQNLYVTTGLDLLIVKPNDEGIWCNDHWCNGPRGELRIGMQVDLTRSWQADYGISHSSFVDSNDRGIERVYLTVTWRPFDRR